jgi:hypothetical protein
LGPKSPEQNLVPNKSNQTKENQVFKHTFSMPALTRNGIGQPEPIANKLERNTREYTLKTIEGRSNTNDE